MIQTTLDQKAMITLSRVNRKTLRRGRNLPVRMLAWFVVLLEGYLTFLYLRAGLDWLTNTLLGLIMLAAILGDDWANGVLALRGVPQDRREVNAAFQDGSCYVLRTKAGEEWRLYEQIALAAETKDYFVLLQDRRRGHVFDKKGLAWGNEEEFRDLIRKKTGLKLQQIR